MRKIIFKKLVLAIILFSSILILLNFIWLREDGVKNMYQASGAKANFVVELLRSNQEEIYTLREATYEDYLSKAEAVGYIINQNPDIVENNEEIINLANLMQIDEIHIFDENGVIIAGSISGYIGVGVDDGEQIGFFKAILDDPSLKLIQEITPATADDKLMQYVGIARQDQKGIIQIGMSPGRMIETLQRTEMNEVISKIEKQDGEEILVIDRETGVILGCTRMESCGIKIEDEKKEEFLLQHEIEDNSNLELENGYIVFRETDDFLICVFTEASVITKAAYQDVYITAAGIVIISIFLLLLLFRLLDIQVIQGTKKIVNALEKITEGNLDIVVSVNNNPEFTELSERINIMVGYLLKFTSQISKAIESVNIDIGMFEYRNDTKIVLVTERLEHIMCLTDSEKETIFRDKILFEQKLQSIYKSKCDNEDETVCSILDNDTLRYIKINAHSEGGMTLGIVVDVTEDVLRRNLIIKERDYDLLTGLYNRRAFMRELDKLFRSPNKIKNACLLMIDMDNLKHINDHYGHKTGDQYLIAGSQILEKIKVEDHVIISRLSGDEFTLFLYGYESKEEIYTIINRLEAIMLHSIIVVCDESKEEVKFSAGYVFYSEFGTNISELLHLADVAMYKAKKNGKGKIMEYKDTFAKRNDNFSSF